MKKLIVAVMTLGLLAGVAFAEQGKMPDAKTLEMLKKNGIECAQLLDSRNVDVGYFTERTSRKMYSVVPTYVELDADGKLTNLRLYVEGRNEKEVIEVCLDVNNGTVDQFFLIDAQNKRIKVNDYQGWYTRSGRLFTIEDPNGNRIEIK
jgi:hypothetical protein